MLFLLTIYYLKMTSVSYLTDFHPSKCLYVAKCLVIFTLRTLVGTLVSIAVFPISPDIVCVFLPIAPGHFQYDHGKA